MLDEVKTAKLSGRVMIQKTPKFFAVTKVRVFMSKLKNEDPNTVFIVLAFPCAFRKIIVITYSYCGGWKEDHCHNGNESHCFTIFFQRVAISLVNGVKRLHLG